MMGWYCCSRPTICMGTTLMLQRHVEPGKEERARILFEDNGVG